MYNLDFNENKFPIIIKPNLGIPIFLNLRDFKNKEGTFLKVISFESLVATTSNQNIKDIAEFLHLNIFIQPILKDEGNFLDRRGRKIPLKIVEIKKLNETDSKEVNGFTEEGCILLDFFNNILKKGEIIGNRNTIYKVTFEISAIKEIVEILNKLEREILLFDIIQNIPNRIESKINFHSIAIFDKDWSSFNFIHATDLHIARRNDYISSLLKEKAESKYGREKKKKQKQEKLNRFILRRDFEFKENFQLHRFLDLRNAKYNFNYNLRKLIEFVNKNQIDFVLLGGDLIDYIEISKGENDYQNNFQVFIDILLGLNKGLGKPPYLIKGAEYVNKKEILCPIFTIPGNHDYRIGHYSINFGNISKIFGLLKKEIKSYYDDKDFSYFRALYSKRRFLKDYFTYINPNLNYKIKIGNYNFIFLDTGRDSIADIHDLIKGAPSTRGLKDYQIELLRAYINLCKDEKIILLMHTPPISPNLSLLKRRKYRKKLKLKYRKLKWSDFYEENLKKKIGTSRLDKIFNLKYETIMYNWPDLLRLLTGSDEVIKRKIDVVLCGHTHTVKEFRLEKSKTKNIESVSIGYLITPIFVDVPCEVYTNNYRDYFNKFENSKELNDWFESNKPFIFITQALGPVNSRFINFKPPGFRFFKIRNNKIVGVNIYSLYLKEKSSYD